MDICTRSKGGVWEGVGYTVHGGRRVYGRVQDTHRGRRVYGRV
jgi:hypothetical protein